MGVRAGSGSEVVACYTDALQRLIERLEAQVAWNGTLIADLDRHAPLPDVLANHDSAQFSLAMTNALAEFDRARFDMRVGVARALQDLGMANTEIAGVFGVSRQLVHRILAGESQASPQAVGAGSRDSPPRSTPIDESVHWAPPPGSSS